MRLCFICTEKLPVPPVRGGAIQIYVQEVAARLQALADVTVVSRDDPTLPNWERVGGVSYVRVPGGNPNRYYMGVTAYLQSAPAFDVIDLFNRPLQVLPVIRAAKGARLVLSLHNDLFGPDRIVPAEAQRVLAAVDAVVAISDHVRRGVAKGFPEWAGKLCTVRSGVDTRRFLPTWEAGERRRRMRRKLRLRGRPAVLHVSRLSPRKGNHLVVEAMAEVRRIHPEAVLVMVGSSRYGSRRLEPYGRAVWEDARRRLGSGVRLVGFTPPHLLPDYFLAGDLFLCASQWAEPLARVHYEAMAAGLPIISTDRGGNGEVVKEGVNGLLARPYDDPAAFAGQIRRLLEDPVLRGDLGRRGRELAVERYSWDRVAAELWQVLRGAGNGADSGDRGGGLHRRPSDPTPQG